MEAEKKNYYGSLCTELYEILHEKAQIGRASCRERVCLYV